MTKQDNRWREATSGSCRHCGDKRLIIQTNLTFAWFSFRHRTIKCTIQIKFVFKLLNGNNYLWSCFCLFVSQFSNKCSNNFKQAETFSVSIFSENKSQILGLVKAVDFGHTVMFMCVIVFGLLSKKKKKQP